MLDWRRESSEMWASSTRICFTQVFDPELRTPDVDHLYDRIHSDAIEWGVLSVIRLNEDDTTSSSRIFIKILFQVQKMITADNAIIHYTFEICSFLLLSFNSFFITFTRCLFQELAEFMGLAKLVARTRDATLQMCWEGLLPRDNPRDTR